MSKSAKFYYYIFYILTFYVAILFIFIFCYSRILIAIRRQAKVMASHTTTQSSTAQTQSNKIQTKVVKLMIFVSAFYAILYLPYYSCLFIWNVIGNTYVTLPAIFPYYYASVFIAFLYTCTNPFIYATKFEPVKEVLLRMSPWKKNFEQASENAANAGIGLATRRSGDNHACNWQHEFNVNTDT